MFKLASKQFSVCLFELFEQLLMLLSLDSFASISFVINGLSSTSPASLNWLGLYHPAQKFGGCRECARDC